MGPDQDLLLAESPLQCLSFLPPPPSIKVTDDYLVNHDFIPMHACAPLFLPQTGGRGSYISSQSAIPLAELFSQDLEMPLCDVLAAIVLQRKKYLDEMTHRPATASGSTTCITDRAQNILSGHSGIRHHWTPTLSWFRGGALVLPCTGNR
jgi:hypothetical protein